MPEPELSLLFVRPLNRLGVKYIVSGGIAAILYGEPRLTNDVDIVVFLPKERIVATGDLLVAPVPFAFGSYYEEWAHTLARVDSLPADIVFPGHGPVMRDRNYLHDVQGLLRALVAEVGAAVADSTSLVDTQKQVTLPEWKQKFTSGEDAKQRAFDSFFLAPAVERAWRQARGEPDKVSR